MLRESAVQMMSNQQKFGVGSDRRARRGPRCRFVHSIICSGTRHPITSSPCPLRGFGLPGRTYMQVTECDIIKRTRKA